MDNQNQKQMVKVRKIRTTSSKIVLEVDSKRTFKQRSSKEKKLIELSKEILGKYKNACLELERLREENRRLKKPKFEAPTSRRVEVLAYLFEHHQIPNDKRQECIDICRRMDDCPELMARHARTVAAGIICYCMAFSTHKERAFFSLHANVSLPTLRKIEDVIKMHLFRTN